MTVIADCFRCGYDLRETADDQPCPECGLLAIRSRRTTDELHFTRPRWLRGLARGVARLLLALALSIAWPFVLASMFERLEILVYVGARVGIPATPLAHLVTMSVLPLLGFDLAAALVVIGVFSLTAPEGYAPADFADRRRRWILRAFALAPFVAVVLLHTILSPFRTMRFGMRDWVELAAMMLHTIGCAPLVLLLFLQLRSLAKRARSAHLAEHCAIVGIGTAVALVYAAGLVILGRYHEALGLGTYWMDRSRVWLMLIGIIGVATWLFVLWSVYLLIRFAISFGRAARAARKQWQRDDRALVPA